MLSEARPDPASRERERESKHLAFCMREHHCYVYMMIKQRAALGAKAALKSTHDVLTFPC